MGYFDVLGAGARRGGAANAVANNALGVDQLYVRAQSPDAAGMAAAA